MAYERAIGRILFALAIAALGVPCLVFSQFVPSLEPVPAAIGQPAPWTWLSGLALIAGGASLVANRTARAGALAVAVLFLLSLAALHGPPLIANLKNQADDSLHTLGIGAAALVLAAQVEPRQGPGGPTEVWAERLGVLGRVCFGLCLVGFGVMHFVFFSFTADFIPAWIPLHRFWAATTGVAQIAAGLAVLSGVVARLAASLSAIMYASWAVLLHAPRVLAHPRSHSEWTDLATVTALCAGALLVAGAGKGRPPA